MRGKAWAGIALLTLVFGTGADAAETGRDFKFDRDTLWFANWTVWNYANGLRVREPASLNRKEKTDRYTRRCFVMSRAVQQFYKFARFDPKLRAPTDEELALRVRQITRQPPWHPALSAGDRVVIPGYSNLRQLSRARTRVLQNNIGLGWPTYARIGNMRMVLVRGRGYQEKEHAILNQMLSRDEMFVAFLSDFPVLHINHSVLVFQRKSHTAEQDSYLCYDPNHPDGPRELTWLTDKREFHFEKDPEFPGGCARIYQVYGKPLQ